MDLFSQQTSLVLEWVCSSTGFNTVVAQVSTLRRHRFQHCVDTICSRPETRWDEDVPKRSGRYFSQNFAGKFRFPGNAIRERRPLNNNKKLFLKPTFIIDVTIVGLFWTHPPPHSGVDQLGGVNHLTELTWPKNLKMTEKITSTNINLLNMTKIVWQRRTITVEYDRNQKIK